MIVLSGVVAAALILAQGFAVWAFLRFVKSFGAYTEAHRANADALLCVHESNLALHKANMAILEKLKTFPLKKAEVA